MFIIDPDVTITGKGEHGFAQAQTCAREAGRARSEIGQGFAGGRPERSIAGDLDPVRTRPRIRPVGTNTCPDTITVMATKNRAQGGSGYNITMEKLA